jgi:MinD superfamily P-loop ATPase
VRIVVLSGKGGTGKTTVSTHLSQLSGFTYLDLDVEEPNGHLFLRPEITSVEDATLMLPKVDPDACTTCGQCVKTCQYNALALVAGEVMLFEDLCHGCGACSLVCPVKAIEEVPKTIGSLLRGPGYARGELKLMVETAVPVIHQAKALLDPKENALIDAPPGTSCSVIAASKGADYAVIVTEPTAFGVHDLNLAVRLMRQLAIPHGVILNRSGEEDRVVEEYLEEENVTLLGKLPFSLTAARALSEGEMLWKVDTFEERFASIYKKLLEEVQNV